MTSSSESATHRQSYQYDPVQRKCTVRDVSKLPSSIFEIAEEIEILDASFGHISSLPDNLGELKNLKVAFFSNNDFETIPSVLSTCSSLEMVGFKSCKMNQFKAESLPTGLRGLILTDNLLTELPRSIGSLQKLQKLMLTGNQLRTLPDTLLRCQKLELLRLSMNQFGQSPDWLFRLPRLAWYSDSQNPLHHTEQKRIGELKNILWKELEVGGVIGQSAKNVVYRANFAGRPVAVKLFGVGTTTDGAPIDDMYASLIAGDLPNIIGGIARVIDGPGGQEGLLMPLIPKEYRTLGLPPDFVTLTRDVFPKETVVTEEYIFQVATDIVLALNHLSQRGVQHGDIYAHNILARSDGKSYIGDFGASSLYHPNTHSGRLREQLDVRGFGYLLDDLLTRGGLHGVTGLENMRDACLNEDPASRPTFADVNAMLEE
jgi:hypothetical protein